MTVSPRSRHVVIPALLGVLATVLALRPIDDPDYHWHLHTGRWIARHHAIPATDPFSHTAFGHVWSHVDWIADLVMYALVRLGGDALVQLATATSAGLAVFVAVRSLRPIADSTAAITASGTLLVATMLFRITPRPQTFTFVLLAVVMAILENGVRNPRRLLAIPLLLALWQNVHASAVIGALVVSAWLLGIVWEAGTSLPTVPYARLGTLFAASWASLFIGPHPFRRFVSAFVHIGDKRLSALFPEWMPTWHFAIEPAVVAALALLLGAVACAGTPGRIPRSRLLVAIGLTIAGASTIRFLPYAAFGLLPLSVDGIARRLAEVPAPRATRTASAVLLASLLPLMPQLRIPQLGLDRAAFPIGAAEFIAREHPHGRMYNTFYAGGYLLWSLDGTYPVFVDGRNVTVYGSAFIVTMARAACATMDSFIQRYDLGIAVGNPGPSTEWFRARPGWSLVYFDDRDFVAVRDDENRALVERDAYRVLDPANVATPIDPTRIDTARTEIARALHEAPGAARVHALAAAVALAAGDVNTTRAEIARTEAIRPDDLGAMQVGLLLSVHEHDRAAACALVTRLHDANDRSPYVERVETVLGCTAPAR